jgi:hypothetical protein
MNKIRTYVWTLALIIGAILNVSSAIQADVITDWNVTAGNITVAAKLPPPLTYRAMAIVQTAVYEAVNAITNRYLARTTKLEAAPGASVEAAVAAASHLTLSKLVPSQQAAIDSAYQSALSAVADGAAKTAGIALGEQAATAILTLRADDGFSEPESYRPQTTPGVYVPTAIPLTPQWPRRRPWVMSTPDQFRPGPPPDLASELWARDYNEIKAVGSKNSTVRSAEQTDMARFWEATIPPLYFSLVRSVADQPGREVTQNARLLAVAGQAMDDALIAVFDAKYHYQFWRPITAIRNGDKDGNDATERDSLWGPFIDTPMHPEYPCAHCIVSAAVGAVLRAEIGKGPTPTLTTTSPTAKGMVRSWTNIDEFLQEVSNARIYDGVHYRYSTEVGTAMGTEIGKLVASKLMDN